MPKLFYLPECTSTNDVIMDFIPENSQKITSIYTFRQTKGRGTYGNVWESSAEENIAFSSAIPCEIFEENNNTHITIWTAIVIRALLSKILKTKVEIKWPNDLIINKKKISGTLIEKKKINQKEYYIFGIGINVLQENFSALPQAGSIFTQTQQRPNLHAISQKIHQTLAEEYLKIPPLHQLLCEYNKNLFLRNAITVFEIEKIRQNGIIQKVDENGKIIINLENEGLKSFYHKEIKMLY